jgi:hypothetical protein
MTRQLLAPLLLAALPLSACQAASGRVTGVVGIDVTEGVNTIPHFAPDGREGVIVVGERQAPSGAAHTPPLVTVMLPRFSPTRGWDVVGTEDEAGIVADAPPPPAIGRNRAVRFARAKVGGLPATLMFVATADRAGGAVAITTYRLLTDGEDASGLAAVFGPIRHAVARGGYCSPEAALEATEGLDPAPGGACVAS